MAIAADNQTATPLTRCQRRASRWSIKVMSPCSGPFLLLSRFKKDFLSDDTANGIKFSCRYFFLTGIAKVKH